MLTAELQNDRDNKSSEQVITEDDVKGAAASIYAAGTDTVCAPHDITKYLC